MSYADYIASHLATPFVWGKHDCILFAAAWVKEATGIDHLIGIKPWNNKREAIRALAASGGIQKILDDRFMRINPNLAKDGDLALYRGSLCLFNGPHIVGPFDTGLVFVKRTAAEAAWSIQ